MLSEKKSLGNIKEKRETMIKWAMVKNNVERFLAAQNARARSAVTRSFPSQVQAAQPPEEISTAPRATGSRACL